MEDVRVVLVPRNAARRGWRKGPTHVIPSGRVRKLVIKWRCQGDHFRGVSVCGRG